MMKRQARQFIPMAVLWLLTMLAGQAALANVEQQREAFQRAWQALGRADWKTADAEAVQLAGYPLLPYLRAEQMRQRPGAFTNDQIQAYLTRYPDWSFTTSLRNSWLRWLGRTGQYDVLVQHAGNPTDNLLRCYLIHAKMVVYGQQPEREQALIRDIQTVWLSGESLPRQCDAAFAWLRRHGGITEDLAWQRVARAMDAGEVGLAGYLERFLSSADRTWLQRWINMRHRRVATLRAAAQWPDEPRAWQIAAWGLDKQARADAAAGVPFWRSLDNHFSWPEAISMPPLHSIGVFHALDLEPAALATIDTVSADYQDQQLLEWRTRAALGNGLWHEVLVSIQRMSEEGRSDERWRYWQARALRETGHADAAEVIFSEIAAQASYYGFLSADWLDQDYRICPAAADHLSGMDNYQLPTQLVLERALELFHVGLENHAFRTWRSAQADLNSEQRLYAAQMAMDAGWLQQAIFTLNDAGHRRQYALRFPLAHQNELQQQIQNRRLDAALVHGLIRAESAWHPRAISSAGARGLMQVTPDTARRIAGQHGLRYTGSASLLEPETNVRFGTANLSTLLARFGNNPVAVLAAYNAGPHVEQRWRQRRPANPPDIWIETMPYFETRDYIPRVLAFSVVYDWRLSGAAQAITARMPGMPAVTGVTPRQRAVKCAMENIVTTGN